MAIGISSLMGGPAYDPHTDLYYGSKEQFLREMQRMYAKQGAQVIQQAAPNTPRTETPKSNPVLLLLEI